LSLLQYVMNWAVVKNKLFDEEYDFVEKKILKNSAIKIFTMTFL
jgi:hypothetical protein